MPGHLSAHMEMLLYVSFRNAESALQPGLGVLQCFVTVLATEYWHVTGALTHWDPCDDNKRMAVH